MFWRRGVFSAARARQMKAGGSSSTTATTTTTTTTHSTTTHSTTTTTTTTMQAALRRPCSEEAAPLGMVVYHTGLLEPQGLADRVPGGPATHTCEPRLGQSGPGARVFFADDPTEPPCISEIATA
eukprot:scaffold108872_cov54-Phaeocystis_antarctica.AAC.3